LKEKLSRVKEPNREDFSHLTNEKRSGDASMMIP